MNLLFSTSSRSSHRNSPRSRVRVRWRFVGCLALGLGLSCGAGYLRWRSFQSVQLPTLWELAQRRMAEGDLEDALQKSQLYLSQRPDDILALTELADWCDSGKLSVPHGLRLYRHLSESARRRPFDPEIARLAFRLALRLAPVAPASERDSLWTDARSIHHPTMVEVERLAPASRMGLVHCQAALEETELAANELLDLLDTGYHGADAWRALVDLVNRRNPSEPGKTCAELAPETRRRLLRTVQADHLLTEAGEMTWTTDIRREVADAVLDRMMQVVEPAWEGVWIHSQCLADWGNLGQAEELARQAVARSGGSRESLVWLMDLCLERAAVASRDQQWFEQRQHTLAAGEVASFGADRYPEDPRFPQELGRLALDAGDARTAEVFFRKALSLAESALVNPAWDWAMQRQLGSLQVAAKVRLATALLTQWGENRETTPTEWEGEIQAIHDQLDRWGLFGIAELGRAQAHMVRREWREAISKWNVIAVDPQMEPWARLATQMLFTCHIELEQWRELGVAAERAVSRWPTWEEGVEALELHLAKTSQSERLELFRDRRRENDQLLALASRYREEMQKPPSERDLESLGRQLDELGQDADLARDLRLTELRRNLLQATGDQPRLRELLKDLQQKTPRVPELMVERVEFELARIDIATGQRIQGAAEAIDLFRDSFETPPRLSQDFATSGSRLARALDSESSPLTGVLRALLHELTGDLELSQQELVTALSSSPDKGIPGQRLVEFYLRHKLHVERLSDQFLDVVGPVLMNLSEERGIAWAQGVIEECRKRGTLTESRQFQWAQACLRRRDVDRAIAEFDELVTRSSQSLPLIWTYSGVLAELPDLSSARQKRLQELCRQLEVLRPGSFESRWRLAQATGRRGESRLAVDLLETFLSDLESHGSAALLRSLAVLGRSQLVLARVPQVDLAAARQTSERVAQLAADTAAAVDESLYSDLTSQSELSQAVRSEVVVLVSQALAAQGQLADAERLLRQSMTSDADDVLGLELAALVGSQGRVREALVLWRVRAGELPAETAASMQRVLDARPEDVSLHSQVRHFLNLVTQADGLSSRHAPLLMLLSKFHMSPASVSQAIRVFDRLLQLEPESAAVLNNLAYVEAFSDHRREQALQHIDQAIASEGPRRQFLDTRAIVLMQLGRIDEARRELEHLTSLVHSPLYCLHLAVVEHRLDHPALAKEALRLGREQGFDPAELQPLERGWFDEVRPLYESLENRVAQSRP